MRTGNSGWVAMGAFLWLLLLFSYYHLGYMPLWQEYQELKLQNGQKAALLRELEQAGSDPDTLLHRREQLDRSLLLLQEQLPGEEGLERSLLFLSEAADMAGAEIRSIDCTPDGAGEDDLAAGTCGRIRYTLKAAGGYFALVHFLNLLEGETRIYSVERCQLVPIPGGMAATPFREDQGEDVLEGAGYTPVGDDGSTAMIREQLLMTLTFYSWYQAGGPGTTIPAGELAERGQSAGRDPFH